jgi:hypothetical protein
MLGVSTNLNITSRRLKHLLNDWEDRLRGREFPCRADFDPEDLKYVLGNLSLLDVFYNPLRFHYLIHGSNLSQRMGKDMTNKSIDEIPAPKHAHQVREQLTGVIERRVPAAFRGQSEYPAVYVPRDVELLVLPLAADGTIIDIIMYAVVWGPES